MKKDIYIGLKGRADRETNREAKRCKLYELLGDLPDSKRKISVSKIEEEKRRSYVLEKLLLDFNEIEPVPAYFVYPQGRRGPFPAILVCIDICCLTDYQALIESRGLDGHGIYYYVPSLLKYFTAADINKLIVPRSHLSLAGNFDGLTPPKGLDRIDRELERAYLAENAKDAWKLVRYNTGHFETAAMRRVILSFLEEWL